MIELTRPQQDTAEFLMDVAAHRRVRVVAEQTHVRSAHTSRQISTVGSRIIQINARVYHKKKCDCSDECQLQVQEPVIVRFFWHGTEFKRAEVGRWTCYTIQSGKNKVKELVEDE